MVNADEKVLKCDRDKTPVRKRAIAKPFSGSPTKAKSASSACPIRRGVRLGPDSLQQ
jgi:hypothetical protein